MADSDALIADLKEQGVKFCLASYVDMHGVSKSKMVPIAHAADMMAGSEMFTGAALDGVPQEVHDEEVAAHPDPATCTRLPWQDDVAWFASDLWCGGAPFEPCSRNILKRQTAAAADMGFTMNLGMEAEFFVFRQTEEGGFAPLSDPAAPGQACL